MTTFLKLTFLPIILILINSQAYAKDFVIYDSIGQTGKPDLSVYGFKPIKLVHSQFLWKDVKKMARPELTIIDSYIKSMPQFSTICLDIEHWPLHNKSKEVIDNNIRMLNIIFDRFKSAFPESNIGYYGIFPIRDYWVPVKNDTNKIRLWDEKNQYLNQLAENMDVIFPSLYTFYKDRDGWLTYAKSNIAQARKYNKPVIVFLWPQYHTSNKFRSLDFLEYDYWTLQLDTAYKYADGIVIWTPAGKMKSQWDETADWWRATRHFIQSRNIK